MKKYINSFFSLKCATALLPYFQLSHTSSAKEITESFAMYEAVFSIFKYKHDEKRTIVVVGDGSTPRTAVTFAYRTRFDCHSVDPDLRLDKFNQTIKEVGVPDRLSIYPFKIEDVKIDCKGLPTTLVLPHAHDKKSSLIEKSLKSIFNFKEVDMIAMPCCYPIEEKYMNKEYASKHNLIVYADSDVWSPKRTIYAWQKVA